MKFIRGSPAPQRIKRRIGGIENEFSYSGKKDYLVVAHALIDLLRSALPKKRFWLNRVIMPNQAQIYIDGRNLEHAAAEGLGAEEMVLWETAGWEILNRNMLHWNEHSHEDARLYNCNRNCELRNNGSLAVDSCGSHINLLGLARVPRDRYIDGLMPFLLTWWIYAGNAWFMISGGCAHFVLSQRAEKLEDVEWQSSFNTPKAFFKAYNEDVEDAKQLADAQVWRRIEITASNSNMSEWQRFLKYGALDIMCAMIEAKGFLHHPAPLKDGRLKTLNEQAIFFNSDIFGSRKVTLADGTSWCALDFQRHYISEALRYFEEGRGALTPERKKVLDFWIKIVDAVSRRDLKYLAQYLDWAAVWHYFIKPTCERFKIDSTPLQMSYTECPHTVKTPCNDVKVTSRRGEETLIRHLLHFIAKYADVNTRKSPYGLFLKKGLMEKMHTESQVEFAVNNPPQRTRALWREKVLRWLEQAETEKVSGLDWKYVHVKRDDTNVVIPNLNPYLARVKEIERGRPEDLFSRLSY